LRMLTPGATIPSAAPTPAVAVLTWREGPLGPLARAAVGRGQWRHRLCHALVTVIRAVHVRIRARHAAVAAGILAARGLARTRRPAVFALALRLYDRRRRGGWVRCFGRTTVATIVRRGRAALGGFLTVWIGLTVCLDGVTVGRTLRAAATRWTSTFAHATVWVEM
jgi:hypothetical protein